MAYTELTKEVAFAEITGVTSRDLAIKPEIADIIKEMADLLTEYTQVMEHQNGITVEHSSRNSGQNR